MYKSLSETYILVKPTTKLYECLKQLNEIGELPERMKYVISENESKNNEAESHSNFFTTSKDYSFISSIEEKLDNENITFSYPQLETFAPDSSNTYLRLKDIIWISTQLEKISNDGKHVYLHELLNGANVYVPKNEAVVRLPELETRCILLENQQRNRHYKNMTKNVDNVRRLHPEDTIAYQMKEMNKQLVAVFQFVLSIMTGFAFGFIGIELMIGNLDFGFRLLLGIMCSLIIALAELYFLAKQLAETEP